uniref:CDP-glycerol glycerophosphotransferase family protein n=1 Tax=Faecalibacillus faecis TaxID=1982628 RepID=UPI003AB86DEE
HDLPGDILEDENRLLVEIKKGYDFKRLETFNEKFNNHEDGKATKRVVDCVFK